MLTRSQRRGIVLALACAGPAGAAHSGEKSACEPSYLEIADAPVRAKVVSGLVEVSANAALIGCRTSLAAVTPLERKTLERVLLGLLEAKGPSLQRSRGNSRFRATIVAEMNAAIGREVASDVHFFDFRFVEFEPSQ